MSARTELREGLRSAGWKTRRSPNVLVSPSARVVLAVFGGGEACFDLLPDAEARQRGRGRISQATFESRMPASVVLAAALEAERLAQEES